MEHKIQNDRLKVFFRIEDENISHTRFERMGVVQKVVLDDKHTFCTDEQVRPEFRTSYGTGLIGEYVYDGLAEQAKKGEQFPKLGVGLLTQKKSHRKFYFIEKYDVKPYKMSYEIKENEASFVMEPEECMGIAARLKKTVKLEGNKIVASMSIENTGSRTIDAYEYQHNFVNIDNIEVGPGYELEMPFYIDEQNFDRGVRDNFKPIKPHFLVYILKYIRKIKWYEGFTKMENKTVSWFKTIPEHTFWSSTENINSDKSGLYWKLSHKDSPASISEHFSFVPCKVVNWGMAHCVSTEVYAKLYVEPGDTYEWERIWVFED